MLLLACHSIITGLVFISFLRRRALENSRPTDPVNEQDTVTTSNDKSHDFNLATMTLKMKKTIIMELIH